MVEPRQVTTEAPVVTQQPREARLLWAALDGRPPQRFKDGGSTHTEVTQGDLLQPFGDPAAC